MAEQGQVRSARRAIGASGAWDWDIRTNTLFVDEGFAEIYGVDPQHGATGVPSGIFFRAIHPDDQARIRIAIAGILSGVELFSKEFRLITPDRTIVWVHAQGQCSHGSNDEPVMFSGVLVDVTERKRTEERLRIAQSAGGVGTFEYIDGFATAMVSEEFCRLLGLHPAPSLPVETINSVVQSGRQRLLPEPRKGKVPETLDAEFRIKRNDDRTERWIVRRGEILREGAGYRLVGVIYDVTQTKMQEAALRDLNDTLETRVVEELKNRLQAEDALRQAQKMEAVGQLTGGIAHDFNNLLMAISSSLALLRKRISDDRQLHQIIDNALQATTRGAALTQRMLAFARRQDLKVEAVDAGQLLRGMSDLLQHTLGPRWIVDIDMPQRLPLVLADPHQLEMAIINLAVNARDSMENGGVIRITAREEFVGLNSVMGLGEGLYLVLSVIDQGTGMDSQTLERASEPFFTTKGVGKGTGLGLSMIDGLAKQLNGIFTLQSSLGEGTTANLWLPATSPGTPLPAGGPKRELGEGRSNRLKVLTVDDDPLILMNLVFLLGDLGHDVLEANSGEAALKLVRQHPDLDLLITDQAMPNMTGLDLATSTIELRPEIAVILATGYGELPNDAHSRIVKLGKPFNEEELADALHQAIQSCDVEKSK